MRRAIRFLFAVVAGLAAAPGVAAAQHQVEITGIRLAAIDDAEGGRFTGGGELFVGVRGSTDSSKAINGMLLPVGGSCPATWEGDPPRELRMYDGNGYVEGPFAADLLSPAVPLRAWRACVYLRDERVYPPVDVARTERVVEPQVAPRNHVRPAVVVTGLASRNRVECNPGDWVAWPKPRVRYAWKVGGRRLRGATRPTLRVRARTRVACGVTVTNALGTKTVWSRTRRA